MADLGIVPDGKTKKILGIYPDGKILILEKTKVIVLFNREKKSVRRVYLVIITAVAAAATLGEEGT